MLQEECSESSEFEQNTYRNYVVDAFRQVPHPWAVWPVLIFISFAILSVSPENHKININYELLINTFFSIISISLLVIIHEYCVYILNNWSIDNNLLKKDEHPGLIIITQVLSGKYQVALALLLVLIRRIIYIRAGLDKYILGNDIIDTITLFLVFSFIITAANVIIRLYRIGSHGIDLSSSFKIRNAYKILSDLVLIVAITVGTYLTLYGFVVYYWSTNVPGNDLKIIRDSLPLIFIMYIAIVLAIVVIGLFGIHRGIAESKNFVASKIQVNLDSMNLDNVNLLSIAENDDSFKKIERILLIHNELSSQIKEVMDVNEWLIDLGGAIKFGIASIIIPLSISVVGLIIKS